jgi:hypothetical protein
MKTPVFYLPVTSPNEFALTTACLLRVTPAGRRNLRRVRAEAMAFLAARTKYFGHVRLALPAGLDATFHHDAPGDGEQLEPPHAFASAAEAAAFVPGEESRVDCLMLDVSLSGRLTLHALSHHGDDEFRVDCADHLEKLLGPVAAEVTRRTATQPAAPLSDPKLRSALAQARNTAAKLLPALALARDSLLELADNAGDVPAWNRRGRHYRAIQAVKRALAAGSLTH